MSEVEHDEIQEPSDYEPPRIEESASFEALSLSCGLNNGEGNCNPIGGTPLAAS